MMLEYQNSDKKQNHVNPLIFRATKSELVRLRRLNFPPSQKVTFSSTALTKIGTVWRIISKKYHKG